MQAILLIILLFFYTGCSQEQAIFVDFSKRTDLPTQKPQRISIKYAYLPQYSHTVSYERHHQLIEYLKSETGLNIEQVFPESFNEHISMFGEGKIDISYSNPVAYVAMSNLYQAQAFARVLELDGKADFRGQIIARSDNKEIKRVQDCKGKSWIAVDPYSAGGYIFALGHFIDLGIKKSDFREIAFAQGHGKSEKVVLAVYSGKYDCGSVREGTLNVVKDKINLQEIQVLANTSWYPGWVYAYRKGLDLSVVNKIKDAMLKLDKNIPQHKKILDAAHFSGIIESEDREFDSIRRLLKKVEIEPTKVTN
ncbi:MAG: phosphate/phosphite/phosphonate ABC transporter substrate-binding protein [Thermodesulfovibrionales bacterium]|nr:phosphate/phosphite/phosphonate ABC transporter substrate-binding protein [Thermodesulfovibrionales bacterium]